MVKTQIYLTEAQNAAIKSLAVHTGKKQSELIREAIDGLLQIQGQQDWKAALRPLRGIWKDRQDLPDFEAIRREADRHLFGL